LDKGQNLELQNGLYHDLDAHIWLLHYLYLQAINKDALEWAEGWNNHKISVHGECLQSPKDMFFLA